MNQHYDVIVVGGGMVGSTLAVALSQQPSLNIALVEAHLPTTMANDDKPELRVSAISHASEALFKNLAIWPLLQSQRISTFSDMKVWETQSSLLHFDAAEIGEANLGRIVENKNIQLACLERCQQQTNIDVLSPAKPVSLEQQTLILEDGRTLTADLIVGADGAQSLLRDWKAINTHGWDYQQSAIVCTVKTAKSHQYTAWQRFLPEGPLAFLPLADEHQCSIVWSNSSEEAELLLALDDEDFKSILAKVFEHTLGEVIEVSERASFPLKLRHADHYIDEGFALVGDAAHTIHPLAGQGVNIGLLDAATLAETVISAHQQGRHIGSMHTLRKYQRRRKADNMMMQLSMDAFKRIFGSDIAPIRWARQFGLKIVNQNSLLKNFFIQQSAGHRFANPELTKTKL
ncbi:FAD-binding protein [Methylophaga sp. 41_12_T18]|nr:FAD-binding protein [Methylophaga sp. 41_12_T18]